MLTKKQEEWINGLGDKPIHVFPYDDRTERLYSVVEEKIKGILGEEIMVEHCGASSLGISGQDEIDVSIVTVSEKFIEYAMKLEETVGPIASWYEDRVRFKVEVEGKKIDLKLVDKNHPNYNQSKIFEAYLRNNPADLERYRILKEECNRLSTKEYYQKKIEFINEILLKAKDA